MSAAAYNRLWALAESAAPMVAEAYAKLDLNALAQSGAPVREGGRATIVDGVAIVPITGPLFGGSGAIDEMVAWATGGTLYSEIAADFDAAMASDASKVVLHFKRCPGGDADGCGALSDRIYAARSSGKRIVSVVDGMCASAGFWIGSAAGEMIVEPSAFVGSVGVKGGITDTSKADEKAGVRNIEIVAEQSPDKRSTPVTDEVIARNTSHATEVAAIFLDAVARNRDLPIDYVQENFGKGDVVIAAKALAAGMIDGIGTLDDVLDEDKNDGAMRAPQLAPLPAMKGDGDQAMAIQRTVKPLRASAEPDKEEKKDDKAEAEPAMEKCEKCGAEMGDDEEGEMCKKCKAEEDDKAEHDEPDGDEEKHEGKKALAALSGLRFSASVSAHTAAIEAKMVPRAALATLQKTVDALKADRAAEKAADETKRLDALADEADSRGYFAGLDAAAAKVKRDRFVKIARNEPDAAAMILETLPTASVAGRITANGQPLGGRRSAQPKIDAFNDDDGGRRVAHGDVVTIERGSPDLMAKAIAHATAHKCSIEEAMGAVVKADPSLMQ